MKRQELLMIQAIEEMAETTLNMCKALRFGLESKHPEGGKTNAENIAQEFQEVLAVYGMLENTEDFIAMPTGYGIQIQEEKIKKSQYWLEVSKEKGVWDE